MVKILTALLVLACSGNAPPGWVEPDPGTPHAKRLQGIANLTVQQWAGSRFHRAGDWFPAPIFAALADDGTVCVPANPQAWAVQRRGMWYVCESPWRVAR